MIPEYLMDLKGVFKKAKAKCFPESQSWNHAIDLKERFKPRDCKVYLLSPREQTALDEFLDENLHKEYICQSQSPMASPFFFVAKKDRTLQPCQDYRYLNEGTVKNVYPLLLITELTDKLWEGKYLY